MRIFSVPILCVFLSSVSFAADDGVTAQKIRDLLVTKKKLDDVPGVYGLTHAERPGEQVFLGVF
jgi:hypothetical protein